MVQKRKNIARILPKIFKVNIPIQLHDCQPLEWRCETNFALGNSNILFQKFRRDSVFNKRSRNCKVNSLFSK